MNICMVHTCYNKGLGGALFVFRSAHLEAADPEYLSGVTKMYLDQCQLV